MKNQDPSNRSFKGGGRRGGGPVHLVSQGTRKKKMKRGSKEEGKLDNWETGRGGRTAGAVATGNLK